MARGKGRVEKDEEEGLKKVRKGGEGKGRVRKGRLGKSRKEMEKM